MLSGGSILHLREEIVPNNIVDSSIYALSQGTDELSPKNIHCIGLVADFPEADTDQTSGSFVSVLFSFINDLAKEIKTLWLFGV